MPDPPAHADPPPPAGGDAPPPPAGDAPPPAAGDECQFSSDRSNSIAKVQVAQLAAAQFGRVRYDQLRDLGIAAATIHKWRTDGYLHPVLPRVDAVGHPARSPEADLAAAVLYAGPHALLSHGTAIWWLGLLHHPPDDIHVSTPRRVHSLPGIIIHPRRHLERVMHHRLPTTTVSQALLDLATTHQPDLLRLALATADYQATLDLPALHTLTGRGIPGSLAIRHALRIHLPQLAHTRSQLERRLLTLCQQHRLPLPHCNIYLHGWLVDAHWPHHRLVVELDGHHAHRTPAQLERDHQRDFELRAAGYTILRYTWRQLTHTPKAVARELRRYLS